MDEANLVRKHRCGHAAPKRLAIRHFVHRAGHPSGIGRSRDFGL